MSKRVGHRTKLYRNAVLIGPVQNLTPNGISFDDVEVTDLESNAVETIPSDPPDFGTVSFDLFFSPNNAAHLSLELAAENRTITDTYTLTLPFSPTKSRSFTAWVQSITPNTHEGRTPMMRTVTLRVTSKPTAWS